jgi:hypothetical protein
MYMVPRSRRDCKMPTGCPHARTITQLSSQYNFGVPFAKVILGFNLSKKYFYYFY